MQMYNYTQKKNDQKKRRSEYRERPLQVSLQEQTDIVIIKLHIYGSSEPFLHLAAISSGLQTTDNRVLYHEFSRAETIKDISNMVIIFGFCLTTSARMPPSPPPRIRTSFPA